MKASETSMSDRSALRLEAEVGMRIQALFGRCPELAGFAVQDLVDLVGSPGDEERSGEEHLLFVTDVGFSAIISLEKVDEVHSLICTAISDVLSERPETFRLLRGRTFARTLH